MSEREYRRIYMALDASEVPADLRDGEIVECVRLGGAYDGTTMGWFRVEHGPDGLIFHPHEPV